MSKKKRKNYNIELNDILSRFVEKAAEENKMSSLRYIQSLIEKAMFTSKTKELQWEYETRCNGNEFIYAANDKLLFTIDDLSDPWFRDNEGCLKELRIHKLNREEFLRDSNHVIPYGEFITIIVFESSGRAMNYAQRYAELYDLEVEH